ncbi:MAG: TIGR01777 family oxidoreductase [Gammaproteobacteria bacterium]|nr:TIGR01777 family oxidoreductase [Gammaproteobacteria bacterium]
MSNNTSKVVIAGGSGFLGRYLAALLRHDGHDVVSLSRTRSDVTQTGVQYVRWDPTAVGDWTAVLEHADAVVNLCGETISGKRWTDARKADLLESRCTPSQTLVTAINGMTNPPSVYLQASGVGYYGTGEGVVSENSSPGDDFLARLAGRWEAPVADVGVRSVLLRFGVVLHATEGALPMMLLPFRVFMGGTLATGRQWLSWIHILDAVRAMSFVMERSDIEGPVNITAPEPVRNKTFATFAGAALNRPTFLPTPGFILHWLLGEQAILVTEGQQAHPTILTQRGFVFRFPKLDKTLENLLTGSGTDR